jgi:hypothetical protein
MQQNKYAEGKIYKLYCNTNYYIGSTINTLKKRLAYHKQCAKKFPNRKIYKYINNIGWENVNIELIENYSCLNKNELCNREDHYINNCIKDKLCLNIKRAKLSKEELNEYAKTYREEHREEIKKYFKQHNIKRADKKLEYMKNYVIENKEKVIESRKKYYENNKEKITEKNKEYVEKNKELVKEKKKKYGEKNKEIISLKSKVFRENNKEKIKEKGKKYYEENKEILLEKFKKYREKNIDKLREKKAEYRESNKEKISCECGGTHTKLGTWKHLRTKKHTSYLQSKKDIAQRFQDHHQSYAQSHLVLV